MRVKDADWNDIRERLKVDNAPPLRTKGLSEDQRESFLDRSRMEFKASGDNPVVKGLKRFIMTTAFASLDDVFYWHIESTESDEKAFRVCLVDGRQLIGTLVPSPSIEGRWVCAEYTLEKQSLTLFEHLDAIHEEVRKQVEQKYTGYKVLEVHGSSDGIYARLPDSGEYVRAETRLGFHVFCEHAGLVHKIECYVESNGDLCMSMVSVTL